jgi:hypothetical protein
LRVPLIMVPDSSPRASKGVLALAWRLSSHFLQGDQPFSVAFCSGGCARAHPLGATVGVSRPGGPSGRRVSVAACPSPDGSSARASAKGGEARRPEAGVREVGIPRPSCSSRAQVGCACSRGLQVSTRVRERATSKRAPVSSSSPRGRPSLRGPWSFLL